MPIEDDIQTREDVAALQVALDALSSMKDQTKRESMLGMMLLTLERLQIKVEDALKG